MKIELNCQPSISPKINKRMKEKLRKINAEEEQEAEQ